MLFFTRNKILAIKSRLIKSKMYYRSFENGYYILDKYS